ncbi:MAG: hypothetical protein HY815_08845 [Candidatus Riflebacteria bacterium]|nr:hypothetical protein [Candidatus Riflebacteria bacterium]
MIPNPGRLLDAAVLIGFTLVLGGLTLWNPCPIYSAFTLHPPDPNNVSLDGFGGGVVAFLLVHHLLVTAFGFALIRGYFSGIGHVALTIRLAAAYQVGYVATAGLVRLTSLLFSYQRAHGPTVLALIVITIALLRRSEDRQPGDGAPPRSGSRSVAANVLALAFLSLITIAALLLQVHQGDFHWAGHGPDQYAYLLDKLKARPPAHFPLLSQHYDELIFHYFVTLPLEKTFNPILPWWLTLALFKASTWAFLYCAFRKGGSVPSLSWLLSTFLMIGTLSLAPRCYYLLFDASNPIFFVVHPGRIVGVGVLLLFTTDTAFHRTGGPRLSLAGILLVGFGLTSTSISNTLWVMVAYGLAVLFAVRPALDPAEPDTASRLTGFLAQTICTVVVAGALLLYALPFEMGPAYVVRAALVFMSLGLAALWVLAALRHRWELAAWKEPPVRSMMVRYAVFVAASLTGLVLFGNLTARNQAAQLFIGLLSRIAGPVDMLALTPPQVNAASLSIGDFREAGAWDEHHLGVGAFTTYYGGVLLLVLAAQRLARTRREASPLAGPREALLHDLFIISAAALPPLLFFMDFVGTGGRSWVKSRFLELPIQFIVFFFLHSFGRWVQASGPQLRPLTVRLIASIILGGYAVAPFLTTQRFDQMQLNLSLLEEMARKVRR